MRNEKCTEIIELLEGNYRTMQLPFIDNKNIIRNILQKSGLNSNEYGTTRLVNSCYYSMNERQNETYLDTRNTTKKESVSVAKRVKKKIAFNVYTLRSDRTLNPTVDNNSSH